MVQVQSSWFPLYDRNPQTFAPNIFFAQPSDYRAATQRVFTGADGSWVGLPVVSSQRSEKIAPAIFAQPRREGERRPAGQQS
jgi:hypothetical protein